MWVATVDFMKAFDSRSHQYLWKALEMCGIESHYINLLRRLYAEQKGTVSTNKESDMFEIKRRTKHGDPLSSLHFNTVLQMALEDDVERWQKSNGKGIRLGDYETDCLTNLRFADDVLLFSTSLVQRQKMVCDIKQSTESVGLKIHPGKTKILSNQKYKQKKRSGDRQHQRYTSEIEEDDWIEYMKRSTATAVERMKAAKIPCWIEMHRRMKWRLAMRTASLPDERWAKKAAKWTPSLSTKDQTNRPVGKPKKKKRWEDEINDFLKPEETEEKKGNEIKNNDTWIKVAKNRERWKAMTAAAVSVDTVQSRRNPPQAPVRPARYLYGVKFDEYEVANIALAHIKDQTHFD